MFQLYYGWNVKVRKRQMKAKKLTVYRGSRQNYASIPEIVM